MKSNLGIELLLTVAVLALGLGHKVLGILWGTTSISQINGENLCDIKEKAMIILPTAPVGLEIEADGANLRPTRSDFLLSH